MAALSHSFYARGCQIHLDFMSCRDIIDRFRIVMANEEAKRKIKLLATRVQGRQITYLEDARLEQELQARQPATREAVKGVLAESLSRDQKDVNRILANSDDSDRLIDEIVRALGK